MEKEKLQGNFLSMENFEPQATPANFQWRLENLHNFTIFFMIVCVLILSLYFSIWFLMYKIKAKKLRKRFASKSIGCNSSGNSVNL
uniref:ATP synthase F0 subunit 8 n=1 Tax=Romanomermis culicivorax TaxID=13658 RepID=A0A915K1P7_ROMCU